MVFGASHSHWSWWRLIFWWDGATVVPRRPRLVPDAAAGQRQRRGTGPERRGIHELEDPSDWPAEPKVETGPLDAARFDAAVEKVCGEVAPDAGLPAIAEIVRQVSVETGADPFLIAALAYRTSRCRPSSTGAAGIGLLGIQPSMFASGAPLPFPRADLDREALLDPAHNLRVGIALLKMWEADHAEIDRVLGSTPHRTALAHFFWGDRVWGTTVEDRTLTARRRLIEAYANPPPTFRGSSLGLDDRLAARGRDAARDQRPRRRSRGRRAVAPRPRHRRHDRRAGARGRRRRRPVRRRRPDRRSPGAGPVPAAGSPLAQPDGQHGAGRVLRARHARRRHPQRLLPPHRLPRRRRADGPCRRDHRHRRAHRGSRSRAATCTSRFTRTASFKDPVRFLSAFVLPPDRTITNQLAMSEKRLRLARLARQKRQARLAAQRRLG